MGRTQATTAFATEGAITPDRSARLYRILDLLRVRPRSRAELLRNLKIDVRAFYRDLEKLRDLKIAFDLVDHRYCLTESFERALTRMPFPDPHLNLHEAMQLAKGRSAAHRRLRAQIGLITNTKSRKSG